MVEKVRRAHSLPFLTFLSLLSLCTGTASNAGSTIGKKVYIIYMGEKKHGEDSATLSWLHHTMLETVLGSGEAAKESLVRSYGKSFNGFVAKLSETEAQRFSEMKEVVSVLPNTMMQLHTTRSWDFIMGMPSSATPRSSGETDVIVGVIDSGVWLESESFSDDGLRPPPETWKGVCQVEAPENFTCNNKIIGGRFYDSMNMFLDGIDYKSPRDSVGHGSHTSSTAVGREVEGASYYGLAEGIARGATPNARLAIYKVCWAFSWYLGCASSDILAAFDDAIADGVNIVSISLGGNFPEDYFKDVIAIGSFHAMKNGILTSNSAGNKGPYPGSVSSIAPWSLSVAANTIDRRFVSQVALGNGMMFMGNIVNSFNLNGTSFPLVYGGDAANFSAGSSPSMSRSCHGAGSLNADKVRGTIVYCESLTDTQGVVTADAVGAIMSESNYYDYGFTFPVPATLLVKEDGDKVLSYIRSTNSPIATILGGATATIQDVGAPIAASFSSRGPNQIDNDILKPDISAPGVDIVAAWAPVAAPSVYYNDKRAVNYNIISGTSMSCPHATGAAAYVKSFHPNWSPAAIKSALMTTAYPMDSKRNEDAEFAYGAGHINPVQAVNPGLVYDIDENDYLQYLCNKGYNSSMIELISGSNAITCSNSSVGKTWALNYPSITLSIKDGERVIGNFPRTVTNVGYPNSTYVVLVSSPSSSLTITVEPSNLFFTSVGEKKSFVVKIRGGVVSQLPIISGYLIWRDLGGVYEVKSPLVVYTVLPSAQVSPALLRSSSSRRLHSPKFGRGSNKFPYPSVAKVGVGVVGKTTKSAKRLLKQVMNS